MYIHMYVYNICTCIHIYIFISVYISGFTLKRLECQITDHRLGLRRIYPLPKTQKDRYKHFSFSLNVNNKETETHFK